MKASSLFSQYYLNFIRESRYEGVLENVRKYGILSEDWEQKYRYELAKQLHEIAKYALWDFYNLCSEKEIMSCMEYSEKLTNKDFAEQFLKRYPVLKDLINQKLKQEFDGLTKVIIDINGHYKEICREFKIDSTCRIAEVNTFQGDSHEGKTVARLTFDDGRCLMYKNRETVGEKVISALSQIMDISFAAPYTKKYDTFYIQEYITEGVFEDEKQVEEYYYKFGKMAAVFTALGTTDLHSENVIAAKEGPKFIDLETIITISQEEGCPIGSALKNTMMFRGGSDKLVYTGMDLSSFSGGMELTKIEITDVMLDGDKLIFGKKYITLPETKNIPKMKDGKRVEPDRYKQYVIEGFDEGYKKILDNKQEFIDIVIRNLKGTVRTVIRNTAFYATYLQSSYMPAYLTSNEKRKNFFELLSAHSKMDKEIIEIEKRAMINLMIPLFECDLESDEKFKTSREMYRKRLKSINKDFFEQERNVLLLTFELKNEKAETNREEKDCGESSVSIAESLKTDRIEIETDRIKVETGGKSRIEYECEKYITYALKGDRFSYVTVDKAVSLNLLENSNDIFVFGGALILLALLDRNNNEELHKHRIIKTIIKDMKRKRDISGLNGSQAEKLLIYALYRIYEDKIFLEILEKKCRESEKTEFNRTELWDFSTAGSAVITEYVLMKYAGEKYKTAQTERLLDEYSKEYLKRSKNAGLFHGYAGDIMLFSVAGRREAEEDEEQLYKLLEAENRYYIQEINNWRDTRSEEIHDMTALSYGAPGILISRLQLLKHMDNFRNAALKEMIQTDIKRAVRKIIMTPREKYYDDTLINGYAGGIFALLIAKYNAAEELEKSELERISEYIETGRNALEKSIWRCQGIKAAYIPNFMNGNMGIAFVLFLIDNFNAIRRWYKVESK